MFAAQDTIFAVASGAGRAAIAVLRISGELSGVVLVRLCGRRPAARRAVMRRLRDRFDNIMDEAIVLWLPGPGSFTGEDSAELHLHGGRAVLRDVATCLVEMGLRPAEPGEFSRRAFLNGRIGLVEAEAVADLVEAETTAQRRQALRQMEGGLGALLTGWADTLTGLLAQQEALIDFPDEDLPAEVEMALDQGLARLHGAVVAHLDDGRRGERLRDGLVFAVLGAPNAGKSTLVNVLAQRDIAIVSPLPGTTRDVLEARIELGGVPVTLLDTAGLRTAADSIEAEGVRRALARAAEADAVIVLETGAEPVPDDLPTHAHTIRVQAKADLLSCETAVPDGVTRISARTGAGMHELLARLSAVAAALTQAEGPPPLTRARHRAALQEAAAHLAAARRAPHPELRGEDLRMALRAVGRITGRVGVEDILDSVFRQFCIGK
jgi:tRNA modification GTPase